MTTLEQRLVEQFTARGRTVAFAETDTGGLAGARVTGVPGASKVFPGSVVAYSNRLKMRLLGVPEATLREHGAVSEACVAAMAAGARQAVGADVAIAASGIAGPTGGRVGRPVGTVWLAVEADGYRTVRRLQFDGDRATVRAAFAEAMLTAAIEALDHLPAAAGLRAGKDHPCGP